MSTNHYTLMSLGADFLLRGGGKDIHYAFFGNVVRGKSTLFMLVVRNGFAHFVRKVFLRVESCYLESFGFLRLCPLHTVQSQNQSIIKAGWHATTLTQKLTSSHLTLLDSGHSTYTILRIMMQILLFSKPSLTNLPLHKQAMTGSVMYVCVHTIGKCWLTFNNINNNAEQEAGFCKLLPKPSTLLCNISLSSGL